MATRTTLEFLKTEAGAGLLLALAAALAIVWANSPFAAQYFALIHHPVTIQIGDFHQTMSVLQWIKNGLMAIFFFVVGLEIKQEVLRGELSNPRRLALPILAALGGVLVPAGVYLAFNAGSDGAPGGWPIPTATDIGFALSALAVAAPRLPPSLRIFLLTLAIVDDLVAVGLIGALFSQDFDLRMLVGATAALAVLAAMSRWKRAPFLFYAAALALLWAFTLKSGINPSVAGVAGALTIPIDPRRPSDPSVLQQFMERLHPYVAFLILPLFAFAAAGFPLSDLSGDALSGPIPVGIAAGLALGKPVGVFGAAALAIGLKLARRPSDARWLELFGVSILCGVGFTMSLFIGGLAFGDAAAQSAVRLGVVGGSLISTAAGVAVLAWAQRRRKGED